jgi:cysteinyl-tRNA synthetase
VAIAALFDLARAINRGSAGPDISGSVVDARATLLDLSGILGLDLAEPNNSQMIAAEPFIDLLIQIRNDLRTAKQFAIADRVRDELAELGVTLEDTKQGTTWKTS